MDTKRPIRVIPVITDTSNQWKFGPVRRNEYVSDLNTTSRHEKVPYVMVKRRKDGKYVVVERYPKKLKPVTKLESHTAPIKNMPLEYPSEVKFRSIKPDWKYSPRHKVIGDYDDSSLLPPIDLGWTSDSKIGSWDNYHHTPRGGDKRIPHQKLNWQAKSKIGSLENVTFRSPRTDRSQSDPTSYRKPERSPRKLKVTPRYGAIGDAGAFGNKHYTPGGALVQRPNESYNHISSKVGSLDYMQHEPQGGNIKIPSYSTKWQAESRIGSLDNVHHKPGGGDVIFLQERLQWNGHSKVGSLDNVDHEPGGGKKRIPHYKLHWKSESKVGSLENIHHTPRGGMVDVPNHPMKWKSKAKVDTKPPKKTKDAGLNVSFDSLDSYECEYVEMVSGRRRY